MNLSYPEQTVLAHLAANPDGVFPRELLKFADGPWLDKVRGARLVEMRSTHDGDVSSESISAAAYGGWLGVKVYPTGEAVA